MTDIMREWNEALTAPKCVHGHLAPVCDLCKKDAEIARLTAERDAAFAMSRCECATDEACAELAKLRKHLGNLLAVLHGDGGHYEAEHGTDRAVADAMTRFYSNIMAADSKITAQAERVRVLEAEVAGLREALQFYANPSDYKAPFTGGMGTLYFDCGLTAREALAARKGTTPTTPPPSPSPRS